MITNKKPLSVLISTIMLATLLPLAGCNKKAPDQTAVQNTATTPQSVYVPPTADQLYQMVGPIALFPDKLVAQVLAGSSYPDQITAADNWDLQNKNLNPTQLQSAVNQQPWDVSVKGLEMFPDVLDQMAKNIQWTTALGTAYVNDPTDVMNAIQVMRQRASISGNLKASKQQKITITPRIHRAPDQPYEVQQGEPMVYSGPNVITPPDQTYVIEPADPDVVYVPSYNPRVAYGEPMQTYPGYQEDYEQPSGYSTGQIVTAGALTFGAGIAIAALSHHDGGWNSWGVHWGGHRHDLDNRDSHSGWHRPAVEYNNSTYVSNSSTIVNRVDNTNNYYNNQTNSNTRNTTNNNYAGENNRAGPNSYSDRPNFAQADHGRPERGEPAPNQPDFNNMHEPHFNKTEVAVGASAAAVAGAAVIAHHFNGENTHQNGNPSVAPTAPNFNNLSQQNFGHHEANGGFNTPHPSMTPNPAEIHQQGTATVQPPSNPIFEHHQWGHQDQPHQTVTQTPTVQQPANPLTENHHPEHQNQPVQQPITLQPSPQPQQSNSASQHQQWGHPSQLHTEQPQAHIKPTPPPQPVAVTPVHSQAQSSPAPEHHQWGQRPAQQSAPQGQQHPQQPSTPQAHANHPHADKKDEGFNHNQ